MGGKLVVKKIKIMTAIFFVMFLIGCSSKSEYYIDYPKDSDFNMDQVTYLSNTDVKLIKDYIPKVVKWYNSIDISNPQPLNFVTDEIDSLGQELFTSESYQGYLNDFMNGNVSEDNKTEFEQIKIVNAIYGQISGIMVINTMSFDLSGGEEATIQIEEENWIELGDSIKNAIEYYYN